MFNILANVVTSSLSRFLNLPVDIAQKKLTWKSSLCARFIDLYSALSSLENSSLQALRYLEEVTDNSEQVNRRILRKHLEQVTKDLIAYAKAVKRVALESSIYARDLHDDLYDLGLSKSRRIAFVDLVVLACPTNVNEEGRVSEFLTIPMQSPSVHMLAKVQIDNAIKYENWEDYIQAIQKEISKKLKRKEINLSNLEARCMLLEETREALKEFDELRQRLAEFIKQNFPLEKVLS